MTIVLYLLTVCLALFAGILGVNLLQRMSRLSRAVHVAGVVVVGGVAPVVLGFVL